MIEIVSATRLAEADFWKASALGISLRRFASVDDRLSASVAFSNQLGLPAIYNARISPQSDAEILVFVHDDVWIDDFFLVELLAAGLDSFDVVGVAGSRRRRPGQRAWRHLRAAEGADDPADLSGRIAHGKNPFGRISNFGSVPAACELLDGVFLAARRRTLLDHSVRFDPQFDFDFYDLDFCRTARAAGLRLGTWPICLTHQSTGAAFESAVWLNAYDRYLRKWGD